MAAAQTSVPLSLAQIQGLILRGYGSFGYARHFIFRVAEPARARALLARLVEGDPSTGLQITTAAPWVTKPRMTLNVSWTFEGLGALGVPGDTLSQFSPEFQAGAVGAAPNIFDVGESAPGNWVGGLGSPDRVHMVLSLFAVASSELELCSARLRTLLATGFEETYAHDGVALPDGFVHFGFRDSLSQPAIVGGLAPKFPYPEALRPPSPAGDFLLGYPNSVGQYYCPGLRSSPLGLNGSFGAFRILRQDVQGFADYLAQAAPRIGLTADQLAAKFLGRWRNGVPLTLSPDSDAPIPSDRLNQFLFVGTAAGQKQSDPNGLGCPVGSHIRRSNPRDDLVAGGGTQQARVIRRNLPYGPAFDPGASSDGIERGLVGFFMNADFSNQFQFLMSAWINGDGGFTANKPIAGLDPIVGANDPKTSIFTMLGPNSKPCSVTGFGRFVVTRGSAYTFFPSIMGLRYLASLR